MNKTNLSKKYSFERWQRGYFLNRELFFYGSEFPQPPPDIDLSEVKEEKRVLFVMSMK